MLSQRRLAAGRRRGDNQEMPRAEPPPPLVLASASPRRAELLAAAGIGFDVDTADGADTTVVVDGTILGKPVDAADARAMLRRLSGRAHQVLTGVALVRDGRTVEVDVAVTDVWFAPMTDADVDAYVATGEPMDKAGAYGIQGRASRFVTRIDGSYSNVVGLPVALVHQWLRDSPETSKDLAPATHATGPEPA